MIVEAALLTTEPSSLATEPSGFTSDLTPLTTHHSPLTVHHSPFTTHPSPLTTHHKMHPSQFTPLHSPPSIHSPPFTPLHPQPSIHPPPSTALHSHPNYSHRSAAPRRPSTYNRHPLRSQIGEIETAHELTERRMGFRQLQTHCRLTATTGTIHCSSTAHPLLHALLTRCGCSLLAHNTYTYGRLLTASTCERWVRRE